MVLQKLSFGKNAVFPKYKSKKVNQNEDNHIENFHFGWYIVFNTTGNFPYIQQITAQNKTNLNTNIYKRSA